MADQMVLSWVVNVAGTSFGPAEAAAALGDVVLYEEDETDQILGQFFGLTVEDDSTSMDATSATRTITLNMTNTFASSPTPPLFQVHSSRIDADEQAEPPYSLVRSAPLGGQFFVVNGSAVVQTTESQLQSLAPNDSIRFLSDQGSLHEVAIVTATSITLSSPITGVTGITGAFKVVPAPVTRAAIYSTSWLDSVAVFGTTPDIQAAPGAREVTLVYENSAGAGPFTVSVSITGKRPSQVTLAPGSIDIFKIVSMTISSTGSFNNNVGQITLSEISDDIPSVPGNATPNSYRGELTDEAQLLLSTALVYMPPSYFALAFQGSSFPQLEGDFLVTTGSATVETTVDQTSALSQGSVIRFASQFTDNSPLQTREVLYTVESVAPTRIQLTSVYTGVDEVFTGRTSFGTGSNDGAKGNVGAKVLKKRTGAFLADPSEATPPTNAQLASLMAQFVQPATVAPDGSSFPSPTLISGFFTQALQLGIAGVPVVPQPITFV